MSNYDRYENLVPVVNSAEQEFNQLAQIHGAVEFRREASFALGILKKNSYLAQVAYGNQDSLKRAIINVAAIGLSLNPVHKLAYLVPRKQEVCLDISYIGYIQLGTDCGAIKYAKAEIVFSNDHFEFLGMGQQPLHKFQPFADDRGQMIGVYCVAETHSGSFLVEMMSLKEVYAIRDRSDAWKAYQRDKSKVCSWNTDEGEMIKKTVIRRAYKTWPKTDGRIDRAVAASIEADGTGLADTQPLALPDPKRVQSLEQIRAWLKELGREESKYLTHMQTVVRRQLSSIDELTDPELASALLFLKNLVANQKGPQHEDVG